MFDQYTSTREPLWHRLRDEVDDDVLRWFAAACMVLAAFLLVVSGGCRVSNPDFDRLMRQELIEDAIARDADLLGCGHGDFYSRGFTGTKNGVPVRGVVCRGLLKGYTVRYF